MMYWPVRICQPVSPSINSAFHPLAPQTNSHASRAMKKQSAKDGVSARVQGPHLSCGKVVPPSASPAGGMDWVEVAKIGPRGLMRALGIDRPIQAIALAWGKVADLTIGGRM